MFSLEGTSFTYQDPTKDFWEFLEEIEMQKNNTACCLHVVSL